MAGRMAMRPWRQAGRANAALQETGVPQGESLGYRRGGGHLVSFRRANERRA